MSKLKELQKEIFKMGKKKATNTEDVAEDLRFYEVPKKIKKYNAIKRNMVPVPHVAYMADLLALPQTKKGYRYLLAVTDIADNDFDIEPIKTKTSEEIVKAFKTILERQYLKEPMVISVDGGKEFRGSFKEFLDKKKIKLRESLPYRHLQTANVEALNKQLGLLLNSYMNSREEETGKPFKEWTEIVPVIREELNKIRHVDLPPFNPEDFKNFPPRKMVIETPKYKVGDLVHYALMYPVDALNNKQNSSVFREGDRRFSVESKEISFIVEKQDKPYYRYLLKGMPNVLWYEEELIPSRDTQETKFVKSIVDKRKVGNRIEYKVWWKGEKKNNATWLARTQLIEDGLKDYIKEYEDKLK